MLRVILTACAALGLAGFPTAQAQQPQRLKTAAGEIVVETVARGLENLWGLAFLPDGRMLVTERPGRLRIVSADGQVSPPLGGVPRVYAPMTRAVSWMSRSIRSSRRTGSSI